MSEALQTARLTHRVFVGIALAYATYLVTLLALPAPEWKDQLDGLEEHWQTVREEAAAKAATATRDREINDSQICVHSALGPHTLENWRTKLQPTVAELQRLREIELLIPKTSIDAEHVEVDCSQPAFVDTSDPEAPVELAHDSEPIYFPITDLSVMNGYALYGSIRDATIPDARAIVQYGFERDQILDGAGIPLIQQYSFPFMALILAALVVHAIVHLRRISVLAAAGHRDELLGFPWVVTMNERWVRWAANGIALLLPLTVVLVGLYHEFKRFVPTTNHLDSRDFLDWFAAVTLTISGLWLLRTQRKLHKELGLAPGPRAPQPSARSLRVRPFFARDEELEELEALAGSGNSVALILGLAGVGKTALAEEFAQRERRSFSAGVFVVDCHRSVHRGLAALLPLVEAGERDEGDDDASDDERARRALDLVSNLDCLLVYDGVDDPPGFLEWLPTTEHRCRVIATSSCTPDRWPLSPRLGILVLGRLDEIGTAELWADDGLPEACVSEVQERTEGLPGRIWEEVEAARLLRAQLRAVDAPESTALALAFTYLDEAPRQRRHKVEQALEPDDLEAEVIAYALSRCERFGLLDDPPDSIAVALVREHREWMKAAYDARRKLKHSS